jgi:hypothetical protein
MYEFVAERVLGHSCSSWGCGVCTIHFRFPGAGSKSFGNVTLSARTRCARSSADRHLVRLRFAPSLIATFLWRCSPLRNRHLNCYSWEHLFVDLVGDSPDASGEQLHDARVAPPVGSNYPRLSVGFQRTTDLDHIFACPFASRSGSIQSSSAVCVTPSGFPQRQQQEHSG